MRLVIAFWWIRRVATNNHYTMSKQWPSKPLQWRHMGIMASHITSKLDKVTRLTKIKCLINWPFVRGIHQRLVDSLTKGQSWESIFKAWHRMFHFILQNNRNTSGVRLVPIPCSRSDVQMYIQNFAEPHFILCHVMINKFITKPDCTIYHIGGVVQDCSDDCSNSIAWSYCSLELCHQYILS